jgi:4-amino-4-deoxy-L-arabinose transferase-like glycosyltransferase
MLQVSLLFELLRGHPRALFWVTAITQAALWWIVPSLFYAAPPGDLPLVLAVGHEFQLGSYFGPPLAFWLAEIAYDLGGMPGVYLLAQICVVATYWAVFELGCATVGIAHAMIAVMLMVGVAAFGLLTPEFGPPVLSMALTALMLLHFWWAAAQARRIYWAAVAIEGALLLLTSYVGLILFATLVVFMVGTARGRALLRSIEPWLAGVAVAFLTFPYFIWLDAHARVLGPVLERLRAVPSTMHLIDWVRVPAGLVLLHAGLIILVVIADWGHEPAQRVPQFLRAPVHPFAKAFIYTFAIAPVAAAALFALITGEPAPLGGAAPLVVLTALAVVVLAGDAVNINRQYVVAAAWGAMLVAPPVIAVLVIMVLPPITGLAFSVSEPANAIGRYFSDAFQRRTGKPLEIAAGEQRLAALVALTSRPRARLYLDATPERSPWITAQDVSRKGAIVVWRATDTTGAPPPEIKARFPDLVPDVPRAFDRFTLGGAPAVRVGWGIKRSVISYQ